jgi:hypothetical protein
LGALRFSSPIDARTCARAIFSSTSLADTSDIRASEAAAAISCVPSRLPPTGWPSTTSADVAVLR